MNNVPLSYTNGKTRKDNMSELVIKTARENEDLPKKGYPTPPYKSKKLEPIPFGNCKIELKDIFNPSKLREWFNNTKKE